MGPMLFDDIKPQLRYKHIFLDTNIIIDAYKSPDAFKELFEQLQSAPNALTISWHVRFELFRKAYEQEYRDRLEKFLEALDIVTLPLGDEVSFYKNALAVAQAYTKKKLKAPSFVDCMIAAYAKRYTNDLFILTRNHCDFTLFLFDRVSTCAVDNDEDVLAIALYKYNNKKADILGL